MDMGPFSATQSNPTHHFFNATNPPLRLAVLTQPKPNPLTNMQDLSFQPINRQYEFVCYEYNL